MTNLFIKTPTEAKALLASPFKTEDEFERMIFDTPDLLGDISLITRQIRAGNKHGIPDIIGVDSDGNVCIVELKNEAVDSSIIPQVLNYAFWAETNPDSIKTLWLEWDDKPDDIVVTWEKLQVRIIVIAPSVLRSTLDLVDKINYQVDLIEVKRWVEGDKNEILSVNKLEQETKGQTKPVSGMPQYDETYYKTIYNSTSVDHFMKYARDLDQYVKKQNWDLEIKFNKYYCGFKVGFFNAFGIAWIGSKTFAFFLMLPKDQAEAEDIAMSRYETQWKRALYNIEPGKTKIQEFKRLFELAYKKLGGE